jgi:hypothetical protein
MNINADLMNTNAGLMNTNAGLKKLSAFKEYECRFNTICAHGYPYPLNN